MDVVEQLKKLMTTPGPAGDEARIADVVTAMWQPLVDRVDGDRVGNVIATKAGSGDAPRQRVLLTAHMDEIALMVQTIEAYQGNGFLRVVPIGGIDLRQVYSQRVTVHGRQDVPGVVAALPKSMLPAQKQGKVYSYEDLLVDTGLPMEALRELVSAGDFVTFDQSPQQLLNRRLAGKAIDNRASLQVLTVMLQQLQQRRHLWDVVVAATVQEEVTLLGGRTVGYAQQPQVAIVLDVCFAKQSGVSDSTAFELGAAPVLDIGVNVHPAVFEALRQAAKALEIKTQTLAHTRSSGTEASAVQLAQAGVATGLLSIPIRYMHTAVETLAVDDIERSGRLLAEFVARLDNEFMDRLTESLLAAE